MKTNKITNFKATAIDLIRGVELSLVLVKCFPNLYHKLGLFFFKNKMWNKLLQNHSDFICGHNPCKLLLPVWLLALGNADTSFEVFNKPIHQSLICVADTNNSREVNPGIVFFSSATDSLRLSSHDAFIAHGDCSFSIYNSSKIDQSFCTVSHKDIVYVADKYKVHAERLNETTPYRGCDSLNSLVTMRGNAEELPRPLGTGYKVTRRTAATVPLTDGQTPPGDSLSVTDFQAQIQWYGSFVTITDQVQYVVQDRVLNEATKVLSLQLGLTIDTLIRDMMVSTASTIQCTHGTNGNTPTEITDADIQTAIVALRQGNARLMTNPLPGENKFGTSPVRSSYWGFMSVDQQSNLEAVSSFIYSANYPNPLNALEAEWGATRNVRWLLNTNGYSNGASPNVYSSFILGQEAYGVVRLGAKEAEFIVKPLGASGTADPLNQRGTVGYKYPFATRILNDNWITRLTATLAT